MDLDLFPKFLDCLSDYSEQFSGPDLESLVHTSGREKKNWRGKEVCSDQIQHVLCSWN